MITEMKYIDVDEGRAVYNRAYSEWWDLYRLNPNSEETKTAKEKSSVIRASVLAQFGKPNAKYPDCAECLSASVFGGPSHEASRHCRSGRRNHCTCDTCF